MQIPGQAAAALGAADDLDETGPFELFRNLIGKLPGYHLFITDFPDILQL